MHFFNHGGSRRLHCKISRANSLKCRARTIPYDEFHDTFIKGFEEVDINKLIPDADAVTAHKKDISDKIRSNSGELVALEGRLASLQDSLELATTTARRQEIITRQEEIDASIEQLKEHNIKLRQELTDIENHPKDIQQSRDRILEINKFLEDKEHRAQMNAELRRLFQWIKVYPMETKEQRIARLQEQYSKMNTEPSIMKGKKSGKTYVMGNTLASIIEGELDAIANDPFYEWQFSSKDIDKITAKFKGNGGRETLRLRNIEDLI
jgi:DNA repair exonuclease SbcCD ATPase subunit